VSAENDFVDSLTLEQLASIFSGESATWADVNPDWPAEPIQLFSPGTDSGTFDYFVEVVFEEDEGPILSVEGTQFSEDDNVLVQGVQASPYSIAYFGYAYYLPNSSVLRAVNIEGIEPSEETAESGEYPLSRPLFIYSDATYMTEKPQVAEFISFYLTSVNDELGTEEGQIGYFPVSVEAMNVNKQLWLDTVGAGM
jgi:phosphate transport system substrate-binding protein